MNGNLFTFQSTPTSENSATLKGPSMKVFWSWQSDTPGIVGRHLIRDAIQEAIAELRVEGSVEESEREGLKELHLDQDRQGIPGSPDLARTILDKIAQSTVFIADVTPVGAVLNSIGQISSKKLINSNVAIELGYAVGKLGDRALLMVMNGYYGDRSDLPFDLQAKAGPIIFNLPQSADKAEILSSKRNLKNDLKIALKSCLSAAEIAQAAERQARSDGQEDRIRSGDWERMADKLSASCRFVRADSQWTSTAQRETWRIAGSSGICEALLKQAGAMLLKSPNVWPLLSREVASETDNRDRWLLYLKQKGCHQVNFPAYEELEDGTKITHLLGGIRDLVGDSARICIECAALET